MKYARPVTKAAVEQEHTERSVGLVPFVMPSACHVHLAMATQAWERQSSTMKTPAPSAAMMASFLKFCTILLSMQRDM